MKYTILLTSLAEHTFEDSEWEFDVIGLKGSMDAAFRFRNDKEDRGFYFPAANVISLEISGDEKE